MPSRPVSIVIWLFWLSTMSWLVVAKVLPPLRTGDPPDYRSILPAGRLDPPSAWSITINGRLLGWAASAVQRRKDGMAEMHSRVYFEELPIDEIAPGWLGAVVKPILRSSGPLDMDANSRLDIDPLGRLVGFESRMRVAGIRDALAIRGEIDGARLKLAVESGGYVSRSERYLSPRALVGDALSPQARLPGLRLGQTWTTPVYSPFRPPRSPVEILEATVERSERLVWEGHQTTTMVVVYRADSGSGALAARETRGKLWVRSDGLVLKQEVSLFNSRIRFDRLANPESDQLLTGLPDDWSEDMSHHAVESLLAHLKSSHEQRGRIFARAP